MLRINGLTIVGGNQNLTGVILFFYNDNGSYFDAEPNMVHMDPIFPIKELEPFDIDPVGYQLVAYSFSRDNDYKALIFQVNRNGVSKIVYPNLSVQQIVNWLSGYRLRSLRFLDAPSLQLAIQLRINTVRYIVNSNNYKNRDIDISFINIHL